MSAQQRERAPAPLGRGSCCQPDQDHEERNDRQRYQQNCPGSKVAGEDVDQDHDRNDDGQHQLRQVAGEVGLERAEALNGVGDQLTGPLAAQPGRARLEHLCRQAGAKFADDAASAEPARGFKTKGAERTRSNDCDENPQIAAYLTQVLPARKGAGDHSAQQDGLRDYQQ